MRHCRWVWLLVLGFGSTGWADGPGYLGITGADAGPDAKTKGVVVQEVIADTPAYVVGLEKGDVITAVNGKAIASYEALAEVIGQHQAGDKVKMQYSRQGKEHTVELRLANAPKEMAEGKLPFEWGPEGFRFRIPDLKREPFKAPPGGRYFEYHGMQPMLGVHLQKLDDKIRERLELGEVQGVLIADVLPDSPAAKAGLASEDVIVAIDGKQVEQPDDVVAHVTKKQPKDKVTLTIVRKMEKLDKTIVLEALSGTARRYGFYVPPNVPLPEAYPWKGEPPTFFPSDREFDKLRKQVEALEKKVNELAKELGQTKRPKPEKPQKPDKPEKPRKST